ncbi:cellulase family glycosylhydrolase [bacterium]|nr:cellulase family glycosylhydrolase [bacterium]
MEKSKLLKKNGKPIYILGVNYWSRHAGPLMWRKWDREKVRNEIRQMRSLGMNTIRSFLYMPDFMPRPGELDEEMLNRFAEFLKLCKEEGMYTFPSFFVGHMSGENWDVPWREGRNFYTDPWMLRQEIKYVQGIVSRFKDEEAIIGWLLSNEIPLYGGNTTRDIGYMWVRTICQAIREIDPIRPISTGDGCWYLNGDDNGFNLDDLVNVLDFFGPHSYPSEIDSIRHSLIPAMLMRLAGTWGLPVLLEEFGCSTAHCSEEHQADYYRTTFHSVLINGGCGCLGWCYTDFPLPYQRPYSHHPFEMLFGVTRIDNSVKPVGKEFQRFASLIEKLDLANLELPTPQTYIIVPSFFFYPYPFAWMDKGMTNRIFLQTFTTAKMAKMTTGFWREPPIISNIPYDIELFREVTLPKEAKLLILPAFPMLTAPTWEALFKFAESGGTVYFSYRYQPWIHNFEKLTGCVHKLRYGLPNIPPSSLTISFVKEMPGIEEGEIFNFSIQGSPFHTAFCPLEPRSAEVLAIDEEGHPAIVMNRIGKGKVFFSAFPFELYVGETPEGNKATPLWRLYKAIAKEAGVDFPVDFTNPFIEMEVVRSGEDELLWMINHSWESVEGTLLGEFEKLVDIESGEELSISGGSDIIIAKKEARVFKIVRKER